MARVYLETSFFSTCVSTRTTPRSLGWRATGLDWWRNQRWRHELFVSAEVAKELAAKEFAMSHRIEYVLTWNVQHLANPNKRRHLGVICFRLGIAPPAIVTPESLQEPDDE